jgi:hypothetical protein
MTIDASTAHTVEAVYVASQTRAGGRRVGKEGFCSSLVGNICPAPILRPLARSNACGDTCQHWQTAAQGGLTEQFTDSKGLVPITCQHTHI